MDNFETQHSGMELKVGHEEDHFSVRGIVLFIVLLVVFAGLTFIAADILMNVLEWGEAKYRDKPATPAQQQLHEARGEMAKKEGVKPQPDWYNREIDQKVIYKTFATPRLQYEDDNDMGDFFKEEQEWLNSTFRDADGNIHIPIDHAIDLISQRGLPAVNGTFTAQPPLGGLEAVSEAAQRRLQESNTQNQPKK